MRFTFLTLRMKVDDDGVCKATMTATFQEAYGGLSRAAWGTEGRILEYWVSRLPRQPQLSICQPLVLGNGPQDGVCQ